VVVNQDCRKEFGSSQLTRKHGWFVRAEVEKYSPGLLKVYLNASISSSVTVRGDFGFFPLNKRRKPLKSKDERKSSGRYGSWKKNMYLDRILNYFYYYHYMMCKPRELSCCFFSRRMGAILRCVGRGGSCMAFDSK
jgi:hypothetical protein